MKFLLDTHAVLWIAESSPRLSPKVRALAEKSDADDFGVAAISLLEIARKAHAGEIDLNPDPGTWLDDLAHRFRILPFTPKIAWRSVQLKWEHKDPADRLICAIALEHKLTLVTHDKEISRWGGVTVLWQRRGASQFFAESVAKIAARSAGLCGAGFIPAKSRRG